MATGKKNETALWVLQPNSKDPSELFRWISALQAQIMLKSEGKCKISAEIHGEPSKIFKARRLLDIQREVKLGYVNEYNALSIDTSSGPSAKSPNEGRLSPTQVQEIERLDEIVKHESSEMFRNEQKSCDEDTKTAQAHRKWTCTLAHEFCSDAINSVVEAKIVNHVECTDIGEYMKAVSIGYNNEMLSVTESRNLLEQAKANFAMAEGANLAEHKKRMIDQIINPMKAIGMPEVTKQETVNLFLRSLPAEYDTLRAQMRTNESKMKTYPPGHEMHEYAKMQFGPPADINAAYEIAVAQGIKPSAKKSTVLATVVKTDVKTDVSKPSGPGAREGCWFCGGKDHRFFSCDAAKEHSGKLRAEKGLGPPPPPPEKLSRAELALKIASKEKKSDEEEKKKKRVTLDLGKKEPTANTTIIEQDTLANFLSDDFGDLILEYLESEDEAMLAAQVEEQIFLSEQPAEKVQQRAANSLKTTKMRFDNNANANIVPFAERGREINQSQVQIRTAQGIFPVSKGFESTYFGNVMLNDHGGNEFILSAYEIMQRYDHSPFGTEGEMDIYIPADGYPTHTLKARYDDSGCCRMDVPFWMYEPDRGRAVVNYVSRLADGEGPFQHTRPAKQIFSTQSTMAPDQFEQESLEARFFSRKEMQELQKARLVQKQLGFMSHSDLIHSMNSGALIGGDINPNILRTAAAKGMQVQAILKGKRMMPTGSTVARKENSPTPDPLKSQVPVRLSADIMFEGREASLIGRAEPGGLVINIPIGYTGESVRTTFNLQGPITEIISAYKAYGQIVYEVQFDREGGVAANRETINECNAALRLLPKDAKDGALNSIIRSVKGKARSIRAAVEAQMPICQMMIRFFIMLAILSVNISPTSSNPNRVSPYRAATGHQLDLQLITKGACGDIVEADAHTGVGSNRIVTDRTITGVLMCPDTDCLGSYIIINVKTGRPFRRSSFKKIEATPEIIKNLDALSKRTTMPKNYQKSTDVNGEFIRKASDIEGRLAGEEEVYDLYPGDVSQELPFFHDGFGNQVPGPGDKTPSKAPATPFWQNDQPAQTDQPEQPVFFEGKFQQPAATKKAMDYQQAAQEISKFVLDADTTIMFAQKVWTQPALPERVKYSSLRKRDFFATTHNLKQAVKLFGMTDTQTSLVKEIDGMLDMKVFHGVLKSSLSITQIKKIIRCSTFFKEKLKDGIRTSIKARIVADGSRQDPTIYDYDKDISSPTVATSSVFTILAQAAAKNHYVITFDIGMAYLNAKMDSEVFMYLDPVSAAIAMKKDPTLRKFTLEDGRIIVKLDKALYGCIESARLWYETLKDVLLQRGYKVNPVDVCVFSKQTPNGDTTNVCFHVDDGLATSSDPDEIEALAAAMNSAFTEVKFNQGTVQDYLGMRMDFTKPNSVLLTMEKYILDFTGELFPELAGSEAKSPADGNLFEIDILSDKLPEDQRKHFHRGVAQALYLATRVRPDILVATIFLTTRVGVATEEDLSKLKRLVRYLIGTSHLGLNLGGNENGEVQLIVYPDASYGVHANGKSHSGICITLGRGVVLAKSSSQKIVTKSSCEAELVTLSDGASLGMYLKNFMFEAGMGDAPGMIREDNMSTIKMAKNGRSNSDRTKHINIRYFFVKQFLDSGEFNIEHCATENQIADILTKPLQGDHFLRLRDILLGYKLP